MTNIEHRPLPEMLGRRDTEHGTWVIDACAPVRGLPHTNIIDRQMVVPVNPEERERCIRAHEMMHARVSPANDFAQWIMRGIASETALRAVEELRVNYLVNKTGFNAKEHLADGSELTSGEQLAEREDWSGCVYTAVGFAQSAGFNDFITGVRRKNREWADALRLIVKKVEKEIAKSDKNRTLASTERDPNTGLAPLGFATVERLAEMVDRFANPPKNEQNDEGQDGQQGNSDKQGEAKNDEGDKATEGNKRKGANGKASPVSKEDVKNINPAQGRGRGADQWCELKVAQLPLTRHAKGGMGRTRKATDMGRNPRRINRALVDPQKRIFDTTKKGNGGVVIIDGSGSMALTTQDIVNIVDTAHGATVAVYSASRNNDKPNLLVLAKEGKMVQTLPERNGGNGVDAPALRWAINQRQHRNAPVVFVTDGQVHGVDYGGYSDLLAMDCINLVRKNKVIVRPNMKEAVSALEEIKRGIKPKAWFPNCWKRTWRNLNGTELR